MGNFNKENKFGRRNFGNDRDGRKSEMHKVICSDCGKNCEVPFRPTGDKPVFCSDCFKNKNENNSRNFRGEGNRDFGNRNSKPRFGDKRSYQNDGGRNVENYKAQFEQLNNKLDKILKILLPSDSEEIKDMETSKSKKFQKTPKKEIDAASLKDMITKTMDKELPTKKVTVKKSTTKKTVAKKKKK